MNTQKSPLEFSVMLSEIIKSPPHQKEEFFWIVLLVEGYSKALLEYTKTKVVSLDRDSAVKIIAEKLEKKYQNRFKFYHLKFSQINKVIKEQERGNFDLGIS